MNRRNAMSYLIKCNHSLTCKSVSAGNKNVNILILPQILKYVIFMKLLSEWSVHGAWVYDVKCTGLIAYFIMRQSGKMCSSVNDVYSSAKPQNCRTDIVLRMKSSKLRPVNLFCRWRERERDERGDFTPPPSLIFTYSSIIFPQSKSKSAGIVHLLSGDF